MGGTTKKDFTEEQKEKELDLLAEELLRLKHGQLEGTDPRGVLLPWAIELNRAEKVYRHVDDDDDDDDDDCISVISENYLDKSSVRGNYGKYRTLSNASIVSSESNGRGNISRTLSEEKLGNENAVDKPVSASNNQLDESKGDDDGSKLVEMTARGVLAAASMDERSRDPEQLNDNPFFVSHFNTEEDPDIDLRG
jgi:hypothetical protein